MAWYAPKAGPCACLGNLSEPSATNMSLILSMSWVSLANRSLLFLVNCGECTRYGDGWVKFLKRLLTF